MPASHPDLDRLRRDLADAWRAPDGFDARAALAFWPYPPEPGKRPTKPGPQPCNQIAGSYEEQLQRVLAVPPDQFRAALVDTIFAVLASTEVRDAINGLIAQTTGRYRHHGNGEAAADAQRGVGGTGQRPAAEPPAADRQPGEEG